MSAALPPDAPPAHDSNPIDDHRDDVSFEPAGVRRRGRPLLVSAAAVIAEIQTSHADGRLFRVHHERPALYARARRLFGSWSGALRVAGIDPVDVLDSARRRSVQARRSRRAAMGRAGGAPPPR